MIKIDLRQTLLLVLFIVSFLNPSAFSQGCSDAGVCSTGNLNFDFFSKKPKSSLTANNIFGLGEQNTFNYTLQVEFNYKAGKHSSFQFKIPYNVVIGNLANISGLGDFIVSYSQNLFFQDSSSLDFTIGGKIPSNKADFDYHDQPLPMAYQTGLGTYDMIAGLSYSINKWFFALGYQHPFNRNDNAFLHDSWTSDEKAAKYNESNQLKRGDDLMFRVNYVFEFTKWSLNTGFLPIYHLQRDEIMKDGNSLKVEGSNGFTYNVNISASHKDKKGNLYRYSIAAPIHAREVRPDGTTRTFVIAADVTFYF